MRGRERSQAGTSAKLSSLLLHCLSLPVMFRGVLGVMEAGVGGL